MSSLMERLIKNSSSADTNSLEKSVFMNNRSHVETPVPAMNISFSGDYTIGFESGLTVYAGPSKHFKSNFCLLALKSYLDTYEDAICLFYDSEFGAAKEYFETFGIDPNRVVHTPIEDVEQLRHDLSKQLDEIEKGDKVFVFVDSVGNLASRKEIEDAISDKNVADMTRAKQLKSLFRIVTPKVVMRDLPFFVVAHTYDTMEMYSKKIVSGGTGIYYSANSIYIIGRQQEKEGTVLEGYNFMIRVEKSRKIKEGSVIPIEVSFNGGIKKYSGLLDIAVQTGFVIKPKKGFFTRTTVEDDKNWRRKESHCSEFWSPILKDENFRKSVSNLYKLSGGSNMFTDEMIDNEDFDTETGEIKNADG